MTQDNTKVLVDKDKIAAEIGRVPGQQADRYPPETHSENAERMYGRPFHEVIGAIEFAKNKYSSKFADRKLFSIDEVKGFLEEFLVQEDQGHKAALEAQRSS